MKKFIFILRSVLRSIFKSLRSGSIKKGYLFTAQVFASLAQKPLTAHDYDTIIAHNIKEGWLRVAERAAVLSKRTLTQEEYEFMLQVAIGKGMIAAANEIAAALGRELTKSELTKIACNCGEEEGTLKSVASKLIRA